MESDETLFAAWRRGEGNKLEELVRRFEEPLFRFLFRRSGDAARAEDLFQETWMSVLKGRDTYDPSRSFKTWLYSIALNASRKSWREKPPMPLDPADLSRPVPGDSPTRTLERRETAAAVQRILAALPDAQRDVFLLCEYEGLTYPEIAAVLERPVGTVKSQMFYAVRRVKSALEDLWEDLK
ncbi:MAG TPA: sigma-70 family RNA polymerase sigma factor [Planctomycetota bacterium]|nr:sigma-70 family RNA polymerase sigma factor [Planctomycetota bacterium]